METRIELQVTDDITAGVRVMYAYRRGYPQTREQPGEPADIEIYAVEFDWLHINVGFDLEILREERNERDRETIDAWIWKHNGDAIDYLCRKHYDATTDRND